MKIEILRYPHEEDWRWCKTCALNTVCKISSKLPDDQWKKKLIEAEHSPLRELWFGIKMTIPYYISVHFVRHNIGVNHYVQSQRNDRQDHYDRTKAPQDAVISHIMSVNAQELVFMAHKRLCGQSAKETREVMKEIVLQVVSLCPEFKEVLVSLCYYRGGVCTEFHCCGYNKTYKTENRLLP